MKRFIPETLRGRIGYMALLGAAGMLVAVSAPAAEAAAADSAATNQLQ